MLSNADLKKYKSVTIWQNNEGNFQAIKECSTWSRNEREDQQGRDLVSFIIIVPFWF